MAYQCAVAPETTADTSGQGRLTIEGLDAMMKNVLATIAEFKEQQTTAAAPTAPPPADVTTSQTDSRTVILDVTDDQDQSAEVGRKQTVSQFQGLRMRIRNQLQDKCLPAKTKAKKTPAWSDNYRPEGWVDPAENYPAGMNSLPPAPMVTGALARVNDQLAGVPEQENPTLPKFADVKLLESIPDAAMTKKFFTVSLPAGPDSRSTDWAIDEQERVFTTSTSTLDGDRNRVLLKAKPRTEAMDSAARTDALARRQLAVLSYADGTLTTLLARLKDSAPEIFTGCYNELIEPLRLQLQALSSLSAKLLANAVLERRDEHLKPRVLRQDAPDEEIRQALRILPITTDRLFGGLLNSAAQRQASRPNVLPLPTRQLPRIVPAPRPKVTRPKKAQAATAAPKTPASSQKQSNQRSSSKKSATKAKKFSKNKP